MKRIINTILVVATLSSAAFTLNSCQDALDIRQPGELQEHELYTSVANLGEVLNGSVYAQLDPIDEIYFTAVFTDEVKPGSGSGGQEYSLHRYFLDPASVIVTGGGTVSTVQSEGIWMNNYRVINRVNRLLEGAKKITPANAEEKKTYNEILAQARAIRAYCYVQLEAYFAKDMKNSDGVGVILLKDVPSTDAKLPRAKNKDVYDFINADLDFARGILEYSSSQSARYFADKGFVNAVSARFNLYRGNTALAKQYAEDVISKSGLTLTKADSYNNLWNDTARGEIIFSLNRLPLGAGQAIGARWNTNQSNIDGTPMWFWGRNLYNLFQNIPGDVRKTSYVDITSVPNPNYASATAGATRDDKLVIDKYPGKTGTPTRNDVKVFRLSEMYFILAEAETAAGNLTAAHDLIQKVREARNSEGKAVTPAYTDAQFAYADILKERRIELALEGHRYVDLKRLAGAANVGMDRNDTDDIIPTNNLPIGDDKFTLPIPIKEISANPNVEQNKGY
ncbi:MULTISPECIES: RagB/SusD family nutrient uptake outer membrane protein [Chryseobacterium]|uniref:RagB/SusD family nutrient uptake outer membrane protein n=1 Tax=Chryseobacterium TaxID=59732 RepID=UPI000482119C|nr:MULTISPECIES: RagB/SusD family nutrient uptake outer membrane protein [Chryseobacterium]MBF6643382.1 RagB/SusD family nutrient uptake outer membrane protein [Chryseobacterium indologenes]MBU3047111.1 RagB/SusD family nutrient uptake outer membrane protein [Chryseobacterium indologenes]QQQ72736.1 RagB/SusD family nutrient uptake outer membrane protein [Chryseobacterium indologenes]TLX25490.1 RagB/SusD family nutrient uptake outer membrane protein [Chryseobacterium indologenes]